MKKILITLLIILPLSISGCGLFPVEFPSQTQNTNTNSTETVEVSPSIVFEVKAHTENIPAEDKVTLYKIIEGFAQFIRNAQVDTTVQALEHLNAVQKMYNWKPEKYFDFTNAFEATLKSAAFVDGKLIFMYTSGRLNDNNWYRDKEGTQRIDPSSIRQIDYTKPQKIADCKDNLVPILESIAEGLK